MKLNLKKKLVSRCGKVKSVDFHPTFHWILLGLYDGSISIYDYNTQSSIQYLEVTPSPIRAAKFLPEKNYIICGSDDKMIRVFNYNTMEKVKEFEAHNDFIRSIAIHMKDPLFLTSSDDNTINLYNADNFSLIRTYEEHKDFVMKVTTNPKDYNMFASASMDKKVKIWSFSSQNSQLTLEGHKKGCNSVAFCPLGDKPYLASGSDDFTIKIWDYTNKHCVFTFEGHEHNITSLCFHPELPVLMSGCEDTTCKFWNINTGKLEDSKIFGYDVVWDINAQEEYNIIGMGCDEAILVFQMGNEEPLVSFSSSQHKLVYASQNNIYAINLKQIQHEVKDGEIISIPPKQLGSSEIYPVGISYSPNGRYFSLVSDKEFIVSPSGVYRSSCVGSCYDLSWSENDSFITKEGSTVKIYTELKVSKSFKPGFIFNGVFGGPFLSVKTEDAIYIYDAENTIFIRKIDVCPNKIKWSEKKNQVALLCDDCAYILKVNLEAIEAYVENVTEGNAKEGEGCDESFEISYDIGEKVLNGFFIEDVFVFQTVKNKINYAIGEKIFSITTLNAQYYLIGYLSSTNRLYLMNKNFQLISYLFPLSFINYQIAIIEKSFDKAAKILPTVPEEFNEKVISFLEKFNYYELCYSITKNQNQKFSLALKLKKLKEAKDLAGEDYEKIKMVSDLAIELGEFSYAEECMNEAEDFSGLLLFYSGIQDREKIKALAEKAVQKQNYNIGFAAYFEINDTENCLKILVESKKYPEAAIFARTYCPSKIEEILELWNQKLDEDVDNNRVTTKIVNPVNEENSNIISGCENLNNKFYELVAQSSFDDQRKLQNFYGVDNFSEIKKDGDVDVSTLIGK